jgi:hypothetical protein
MYRTGFRENGKFYVKTRDGNKISLLLAAMAQEKNIC